MHEEGCVPEQYEAMGVMLDGNLAGAPYYVMFEVYQPSGWSIWIYEETNGLEGLQRGDEIEVSETCGHLPDTIVF